MKNIPEIIALLEEAISKKQYLAKHIDDFQRIVWDEKFECSEPESEILCDLAYDLDYFEPNPEWKAQDPSYYGEERAVQEIESA